MRGSSSIRRGFLACPLTVLLLAGGGPGPLRASGHGPLFGLATPTNGARAWSVDFGVMGRHGDAYTAAMVRAMASYGLTEDVQISVSVPFVAASGPFAPGRMTGMMPATADLEAVAAWRLHRRGTGVGRRIESTVYGGLVAAGPQQPAGSPGGLSRAPGLYAAAATGMASRSHYLWIGGAVTRYAGDDDGNRRPSVLTYTAVWGYRPPAFRRDYPHWDWRLFVELTGERTSGARQDGVPIADSSAHRVFLGPSILGIWKNHAVQAGLQVPIYRDAGSGFARERLRYAANYSRFF